MKILHIVPTYYPAYRGGGPIFSVHFLNKYLVRAGAEVTVYTTNMDGSGVLDAPVSREVDIDGVKIHYFPITWRGWEYSIGMEKAVRENIKNFDLIHITSVFLSASAIGAHYAKKFGKPYIISPRGSLMREPMAKKSSLKKKIYLSLIEKRNLSGANAIHFTAEEEMKEYLAQGLALKDYFIVPNGLAPEELGSAADGNIRKAFGIGIDKKIILSLGRLNWKKGFDTLIPAFAELLDSKPNAVILIAGGDEGGYKKIIEELAEEYGVAGKIIFAGMLTGGMKTAAYEQSQVFVLPSYSENFGMSVAEAMYLKLPVIVSEGVAISDKIRNAGAGIVIKKDAKECGEALRKILSDPVLGLTMGERGRELVVREFSIGKVADKFMEVYETLVKGGRVS